MGQPIRVTATNGVNGGATVPVALDTYRGSSVGVKVDIVSGTPTYTVESTFDPIQQAGWTAAAGNWEAHSQLTGKAVAASGGYDAIPTAVRARITSGTGTIRLSVTHPFGCA